MLGSLDFKTITLSRKELVRRKNNIPSKQYVNKNNFTKKVEYFTFRDYFAV